MPQPNYTCRTSQRMLRLATRGGLARIPDGKVLWSIVGDLPHIGFDELKAAMEEAWGRWAAVCGIAHAYRDIAANAQVWILSRAIDGESGVLAEAELPMPNGGRQRLWFDTSEQWASQPRGQREIDLLEVATHESGHLLGAGHAPKGSRNRMAPVYQPDLKEFGPWDIDQAVRRYGPAFIIPSQPTPAPTSPASPPGGIMGNFTALLKLAAQLAPLITWFAQHKDAIGSILAVLKQLAEAFAAKPQSQVEALLFGMDQEEFRQMLRDSLAPLSTWAAKTSWGGDDILVSVFEFAIEHDQIFNWLWAVFGGREVVTSEQVAQAVAATA